MLVDLPSFRLPEAEEALKSALCNCHRQMCKVIPIFIFFSICVTILSDKNIHNF